MKTVTMSRDFHFRAGPRAFVEFRAGETYRRVTEAQAEAIEAAGAGAVMKQKKTDERSEP